MSMASGGQGWQRLCVLARMISPAGTGDGAQIQNVLAASQWPAFLALAAEQRVMPALYRALVHSGAARDLEPAALDALAAADRYNVLRCRRLLARMSEAAHHLESAGVAYAFVKGAAVLAHPDEQPLGARVVGDLDLLVAWEAFDAARAALETAGYRSTGPVSPARHDHVLMHDDGKTTLDLHWTLGPQRRMLPTADVLAGAEVVRVGQAPVRLASPTHRIIHTIFHAQLQDRHHIRANPGLRAMQDVAGLNHARAGDLDWPDVQAAFAERGQRAAYRAFQAKTARLFRIDLPDSRSRRARGHVHRLALQADRPGLQRLVDAAAASTHVFTRTELAWRYPGQPTVIAAVRALAWVLRRHDTSLLRRLRNLIQHYRVHSS